MTKRCMCEGVGRVSVVVIRLVETIYYNSLLGVLYGVAIGRLSDGHDHALTSAAGGQGIREAQKLLSWTSGTARLGFQDATSPAGISHAWAALCGRQEHA
ncbi:hypothetical protein ISCGN_028622 [Ixodes scapularis]